MDLALVAEQCGGCFVLRARVSFYARFHGESKSDRELLCWEGVVQSSDQRDSWPSNLKVSDGDYEYLVESNVYVCYQEAGILDFWGRRQHH